MKISEDLSVKIANMSFVCACLVVVMHSPMPFARELSFTEHIIKDSLSIIAVPVFFIISGFLLGIKIPLLNDMSESVAESGRFAWWRKAIAKRVRTIWIPYLLLSFLWFPIKCTVHLIGVRYFGADASAESMHITWYNFLSGAGVLPWGHSAVVGFWYLKALFLLVIISPIVWWMVAKSRIGASLSLLALLVAWTVQGRMCVRGGVFMYELNVRCVFFFAVGMTMSLYAPQKMPQRIWMLLIPLAVASCWLYELYAEHAGLFRTLFLCLTTLLLAATVWSVVPSRRWPCCIAGNSFALFAVHGSVLYLLPIPFKALHCWSQIVAYVGPLSIAFLAIVIGVCLVTFLKWRLPRFSAICFGGR